MTNTATREQTLVSWLREVCSKHRNAPALEHAGAILSYEELHRRTDRLAVYLRERMGICHGDRVGICLDASINMVTAMLAVLKAGACYVPLDADLPKQRLIYMVRETRLKAVLTQRKYSIDTTLCTQESEGVRLLLLDQEHEWQKDGATAATADADRWYPWDPQPDDLAYIIYTSGSTGEPKGVMIEHRGLLNLALANVAAFGIKRGTRLIQFASISFDAAAWEIFSVLAGGGTLILGTKEDMIPGRALAAFLAHRRVTMICIAPSLLSTLYEARDDLPWLRTIVVAGEACPLSVVRDWATDGRTLWNAYGPTEITVCATMYRFAGDEDRVPIGEPLPGVEVYVADDTLKQLPPGEAGELYIGGLGVARGYLDKPELTAASFIDNPWGPGKLYRSGDLVVRNPQSGLLEFIGRRDNQVKIRGFRVELGAIEQALGEHPGVLSAAVIAEDLSGYGNERSRSLIGYYVPRPGVSPGLLTQETLTRFLDERLPNYMIPPIYVQLESMPMLPNRSKVDRSALPRPSTRVTHTESGDARAWQIAALFDQALGLPLGTFDIESHFFERGGNSMAVAHLILALKAAFGIRLPARQIYQHPTPQSMAGVVDAMLRSPYRTAAAEVVDVHAEARLDASVRPESPAPPFSASGEPGAILLTGANGFMGAFLLAELAAQGGSRDIHCLIRADCDEEAHRKLEEQLRAYEVFTTLPACVRVFAGDIRDERMGLSAARYAELASAVDTVFHCGADVNHLKPYATLKDSNVEGTRNALRFACTSRTKRFHFASTLGVTGSADIFLGINRIDEDFDIELSAPIMDVENGYTKSKWVAERIVREAAERGLPVAIYRTGFLTGTSQTGMVKTTDLMSRMVVGCIQLGCYPNLPEKYWCPIPVDFVAKAVACIAAKGGEGVYHLVVDRDKEPRHIDLFRMINTLGFPVREVDPSEWFEALASCPTDNALYPVAPFLLEKVHEGRNTILEVHHRSAVCGNSRTYEALLGTGIEVPPIDRALIQRYLDFFIRSGILRP